MLSSHLSAPSKLLSGFILSVLCTFCMLTMAEGAPVEGLTIIPFDQAKLPSQIKYKGKVLRGSRWVDAKGENVVIFSEITRKDDWYFYLYHYRITNGTIELIRRIRDKQECARPGNLGKLHTDSIHLTDLDQDRVGEISFTYLLGCGEASQSTAKLMFTEDGKKFAIRGTPRFEDHAAQKVQKTQYKIDKGWAETSPQFLPFALKTWNTHTSVILNRQKGSLSDEQVLKQISTSLNIVNDGFGSPLSIDEKTLTAFGWTIKSGRFDGPCFNKQVSTFNREGKLIKAVQISLGCDCPSECEGCSVSSSIKWTDRAHFSVETKEIRVIKEITDEECETKEIVTEVKYEIEAEGMIKEIKK